VATIRAGLELAEAGDTILIKPGEYIERDLELVSGVILLGNTTNPSDVIVDAQLHGSVFRGEDLNEFTLIENLTIKGGRGVYEGGVVLESSKPTIRNCVFLENNPLPEGGAITLRDSSPKVEDCAFIGNYSLAGASSVYMNASNPRFLRCEFTENSGDTIAGLQSSECILEDCSLENYGAVELTFDGSFLNLINTTIGSRAGIRNYRWGVRLFNGAELVAQGVDFVGLSESPDESAISAFEVESVQLTNCSFSQYSDHAIDVSNCNTVTMDWCDFTENSSSSIGGAVYLSNVDHVQIENSSFIENTCEGFTEGGGAINARIVEVLNIYDTSFHGNESIDGHGGAICCNSGGSAIFEGCDFTGNHAGKVGGAVSLNGVDVSEFEDCHFIDNASGEGKSGGALYLWRTDVSMNNCWFEGNESGSLGGAIYGAFYSLECSGTVFYDNYAEYVLDSSSGSALGGEQSSTLTLSNCTVFGNESPSGGAAILVGWNADLILENTIIAGTVGGRSVDLILGGSVTVTCSDIINNDEGDWVGVISDDLGTNGNISLDPLFCDPGAGIFDLVSGSPCSSDNSPCGELIGAMPVDCR